MYDPLIVKTRKYVRMLDFDASFALVGNAIDGRINLNIIEYENFRAMKVNLFDDIRNINGIGEWDARLYQTKPNSRIRHQYGYYQYPKPAKHILKYSHSDFQLIGMSVDFNEIIMVYKHYLHYTDWSSKFPPLYATKVQLR